MSARMAIALGLLTASILLPLLLPQRVLLRASCPAVVKEFLTALWERYPRSYEWSAIVAGWLTCLALGLVLGLTFLACATFLG